MTELLKIKSEFLELREKLFQDENLLKDSFKFCVEYSIMVEEYIRVVVAGEELDGAIVSTGSFSRRELSPYSDIDVMLIFKTAEARNEQIANIVRRLWDAGIEVSHTVREFSDIRKFLEEDLHAFTQLFETRYIYGRREIYVEWQKAIFAEVNQENRKKIIYKYFDDIQKRHEKFGSSSKELEPNVKFTAGGLRDLHSVEWMYAFKNNIFISDQYENTAAESFISLLKQNRFINAKAAKRLKDSYRLVLGVRNYLHLINRRKNDRLEFSSQEIIAKNFGFDGQWNGFMKIYFRAANILNRFGRTLSRSIEEQVDVPISDILAINLDDDFYKKANAISIKDESRRILSISEILRVFYYRGLHDARFDENLRSLIIESVESLEESAEVEHSSSVFFREILRLPKNVGKTLAAMNELGALGAFLPPFRELVGFFQPGVYHCYTADEHTIIAINNLEKLETGTSALHKIFSNLKTKDIIFLAVLFHDIAKPIDISGHEILGAEIAGTVMPSLGYEQDEISLVQFLVRHHLTMEQVAFRRNLNDPQTLNNFTSIFSSKKELDLLYLLTYADLSAVSPTVWTHWKSDLLYELYRKAGIMLDEKISGAELLFNETREIMGNHAAFSDTQVKKHIEAVNDIGYLQHFSAEEINSHAQDIETGPVCSVFFKEAEGFTNISIITKDAENLLARICGALTINDLNIHGAKIFTRNDGIVIDSFNLSDFRTGKAVEVDRYEKIERDLGLAVENQLQLASELNRIKSKWWRLESRIFRKKSKVKIDFEEHDRYTIIDVFSPDKLGLLYQITHTMNELGLSIYMAKISTKADDVVDTFYVLDRNGNKVSPYDYELIRLELTSAVQEIL